MGWSCTAAPAAAPPSADVPFRFDHVSAAQGLSSPEVWSVLRDRRGFLWFGTLDGLNRFDGYQMKVFKYSPADPASLSDNAIRTLYEDRAGILWIGTWTGGLDRYDRDTETFTHFQHDPANPDSLSSNGVFAILEDRAGMLWLGTRTGGLEYFDPKTNTFTHYRHDPAVPTSLGNDSVFALWEDGDGALWVGTEGGLDRLDPATGIFRHYRYNPDDPTSLSSDTIRSLYVDTRGSLWVGTWGGGLNRFDRNTETFVHYQHEPGRPQSLSNDGVFAIQQDATGALWIGTLGGGLNRFDPQAGTFRHFEADESALASFRTSEVYDMVVDAGSAWFATNVGVIALDMQPKPFGVLQNIADNADSLADNRINAVYADPQGVLWVATVSTGFNRVDRVTGHVSHFQHDPADASSIGSNEIYGIAPERNGKLWLAAFEAGISLFDPKTGQSLQYRHDPDNPASLSSNLVTTILEDRSGTVWAGTWDAGLNRLDPATGTITQYRHDPADPASVSDDNIQALLQDPNGDLWVGTLGGGLNRFDPATETFTRYPDAASNPKGLPANRVTSLLLDRAGRLWVATWGGGLARLNRATGDFTYYDRASGLPSDAICAILEDSRGLLWLSTNNGLVRFDPQTGAVHNYDEQDGLPGTVFQRSTAAQGPGGELLFGGINGLLVFQPDQIHDNLTPPPVVLTAFLLANKPVPIGPNSVLRRAIDATAALELSYQDRVISFEFAALDFTAPQKNRYRYMLEGFDTEWTEVGSDRRLVTYTNLGPGRYVFRVLGSNHDGTWNDEGAALTLTITPPWWETFWFRLLLVLAGAGLVAAVLAGQRRNAMIQQRKLEAMVAERTHELQDARTQINTLFDTSPLGICVATLDGKILGVNRALQRISGYSEAQLLGANVSGLYANPAERAPLLAKLDAEGFVSDYGVQMRRRDRSIYFASLSLSRLEMAGQAMILGITDDITDQVEARQALATLQEISYDLAAMPDLSALLEGALQQLSKVVDFQRAALMLIEEDGESLAIYAYLAPALAPEFTPQHVPIKRWPFLQATLQGAATTYIPDLQANQAIMAELDRMPAGPWSAVLEASRSWLGLPLLSGERRIGLLNVLGDEANHYTTSDIELARTYANQLAVAVDNIYLKDQAGLTAAAEERSRIARELHDSVTQALYSMTLLADATILALTAGKLEAVAERLARIKDVAHEAMTEMRWLVYNLHPTVLADAGLAPALQERLEAVEARSGVKAHFQVKGQPRLSPASERELFWVAQEGLNNALRHAHASQVWVDLAYEDSRCRLTIRDDGVGFRPDAAEPYGGYGLANMRARLAQINGELKIITKLHEGTTLEIEVNQ